MTGDSEAKKCRMCGKVKSLVKAHLMPDGLKKIVENFKATGAHLKAVSLISPKIRKVQTLEFDSGILCASCDGTLGKYDHVFIEFVRDWYFSPIRLEGMERFRPAPVYKYCCNTEELKLAFAAIMFRYSISSRYQGANIGKTYDATFSEWLARGDMYGARCNNLNIRISGMSREPYGLCGHILNGPIGDQFTFLLEMYGLVVFVNVGGKPVPDSIIEYPEVCNSSNFIEFPIVPFEQCLLPQSILNAVKQNHAKKA